MKKVLIIAAFLTAAVTAYAGEYFMPSPKNPVVVPPPLPLPEPPCLTYDFLDIQYIYTDINDHGLDDGHGAGANISKSLTGPFYLTGSFTWVDADRDRFQTDLYGASAGLGIKFPVSHRVHFNLEAGGLWSRKDQEGEIWDPHTGRDRSFRLKEDDYGFFAGPGVRICVTERIELFGNVYYVYFDEDNYDTVEANVGIVFDLTEYVALKVGGLFGEDEQTLFVGARVYY